MQTIKISDQQPPTAIGWNANLPAIVDSTANNPGYWNEPYWLNVATNTSNLREAPVALSIVGIDDCAGTNVNVAYLLFLDLDLDGTMETVINSNNPPAAGQVNFGNTTTPNFAGGIPRNFDEHTQLDDEKYRFGIWLTVDDSLRRTAQVVWQNAQDPNAWVLPELPPGNHKIKWILYDQCGNESVWENAFTILANPVNVHAILGSVVTDCENPAEPGMTNWKAQLTEVLEVGGDTLFLHQELTLPNAAGQYFFQTDTGMYQIRILPPNAYWEICDDYTTVHVASVGDSTIVQHSAKIAADCPFLETDIGTPLLRRCFDNLYTIRYCNKGSGIAGWQRFAYGDLLLQGI